MSKILVNSHRVLILVSENASKLKIDWVLGPVQ